MFCHITGLMHHLRQLGRHVETTHDLKDVVVVIGVEKVLWNVRVNLHKEVCGARAGPCLGCLLLIVKPGCCRLLQ